MCMVMDDIIFAAEKQRYWGDTVAKLVILSQPTFSIHLSSKLAHLIHVPVGWHGPYINVYYCEFLFLTVLN